MADIDIAPPHSALDWRGLTERIRVWQAATFPAVTEEVGKWRSVNELAELGKKVVSGAPIAEIREEAADVIITMQHMERIKEFTAAHKNCRMERSWLRYIGNALIWNRPAEAFPWLLSYFESESAAFAEVERKHAKNLKRKWDIRPDGSGQHLDAPLDMVLHCPSCGLQHIDAPSEGWDNPPHRSHLCHGCGTIWRPADVPTNGVVAIATRGSADTWIAGKVKAPSTPANAPPRAHYSGWTEDDLGDNLMGGD